MEAAQRCPQCGSERAVPIVYGMPGGETIEASERGELVLGGCVVSDDDPEWSCLGCWTQWSDAAVWPGPPPEEKARLQAKGRGVGWWEGTRIARED